MNLLDEIIISSVIYQSNHPDYSLQIIPLFSIDLKIRLLSNLRTKLVIQETVWKLDNFGFPQDKRSAKKELPGIWNFTSICVHLGQVCTY